MRNVITFIFGLFIFGSLHSQNPVLVSDFNTGTEDAFDKFNFSGVTYKGNLIFPIQNSISGYELGIYDGVEIKLIKDINSGSSSSNPQNFLIANEKVYFIANDGINGTAIWETDGTSLGTKILIDPSGNQPVTELNLLRNGELFYCVNNKSIYVYDGVNSTLVLDNAKLFLEFNSAEKNYCLYNDGFAVLDVDNAEDSVGVFIYENGLMSKKGSIEYLSFSTYYGIAQEDDGLLFSFYRGSGDISGVYYYSEISNSIEKVFDTEWRRIARNGKNNIYSFYDGAFLFDNKSFKEIKEGFPNLVTGEMLPQANFDNGVFFLCGGGFFDEPSVGYSDGTEAGTIIFDQLERQSVSNFLRVGNYAFYAVGVNNGSRPVIFLFNYDTKEIEKIYSSNLSSTNGPSVLFIGAFKDKLYFVSNLDNTKGRELYSLDLDFNTKTNDELASKQYLFFTNEYFIINNISETNGTVSIYNLNGSLLHNYNVQSNTLYSKTESTQPLLYRFEFGNIKFSKILQPLIK